MAYTLLYPHLSLNEINNIAKESTIRAHVSGEIPVIDLTVRDLSPYSFGYLVYFFMFSCAISGYLLGVNPFDQPGVEAYKNNMYALLGKPGYENFK